MLNKDLSHRIAHRKTHKQIDQAQETTTPDEQQFAPHPHHQCCTLTPGELISNHIQLRCNRLKQTTPTTSRPKQHNPNTQAIKADSHHRTPPPADSRTTPPHTSATTTDPHYNIHQSKRQPDHNNTQPPSRTTNQLPSFHSRVTTPNTTSQLQQRTHN